MRRDLSTILFLCSAFVVRAQVQPSFIWADSIATTVSELAGPGVIVTNVSYQFVPEHLGSFVDTTASIGMEGGIILATGHIYMVAGPNFSQTVTAGGGYVGMMDADLQTAFFPPVQQSDAGILTIDLVPLGDSLQLRYVFGSEEYNEWVCSDKNDAVGMFLSGPGIEGPFMNGAINMATLPGTGHPVCVNTVNMGIPGFNSVGLCNYYAAWELDSVHYLDNTNGLINQLDGYTTVLTAKAAVIPGAAYQLRIAIADMDDANYDSAVFLEAGSLTSDMSTTIGDLASFAEPTVRRDPISGRVNIEGLDANKPVTLTICDGAGRLVSSMVPEQDGTSWYAYMHTAPGLYAIRAMQGAQQYVGRIIVP